MRTTSHARPTRSSALITQADGSRTTAELTPGVAYFREAGARHDVSNPDSDLLDFVEVEILPQSGTSISVGT